MDLSNSLANRVVLVVEDDYFVAQAVASMLRMLGSFVVGPIGTIEDALELINRDSASFDSVLLDVNIRGTNSFPIADALIAKEKPFVFATGYSSDAIDQSYQKYPRCEKPFTARGLVEALTSFTI